MGSLTDTMDGMGGGLMDAMFSGSQSGNSGRTADAQSQLELSRAEQDRRDRDRANLLAQARAAQRARLGALGIGSSDGSGAALLQGLAIQSAEEAGLDQRITLLRERSLLAPWQGGSSGGLPESFSQVSDMAGKAFSYYSMFGE